MKTTQLTGILALILAAIAGYMGYSESQGLVSSFSSAVNGQPSDNVLLKYAASGLLTVAGVFLLRK